MSVLIGSTGYIGSTLGKSKSYSCYVNSKNFKSISGKNFDLLVCAGLPAQKWRANNNPHADWQNVTELSEVLKNVQADVAVLISTFDVYQPPIGSNENCKPSLFGSEAYGVNRAWFELFFQSNFPKTHILRLPGLYSKDVRKNLIHDILNNKFDQLDKVNMNSTFQFFNTERVGELIELVLKSDISILNVSSEPVFAQEIAGLANINLQSVAKEIHYDVKTIYATEICGQENYLFSKEFILYEVSKLFEDSIK